MLKIRFSSHLKRGVILTVLLALGWGAYVTIRHEPTRPEATPAAIQSNTTAVQGDEAGTPTVFNIADASTDFNYTSPAFKANYEFNAIAPEWKETQASESNRKVAVRSSTDGQQWTEWIDVEAMPPQKDDAPDSDRVFPEAPIITIGKYFQYKVELLREADAAPTIEGMEITYINSRSSIKKDQTVSLRERLFPKAHAENALPQIVSRAAWGSPDPNGHGLKNQSNYWPPEYQATKQIFIHHTVSSDHASQVDGASIVRAVYEYHAHTRGWGDIGYNFLVDQTGRIYEGRAHGDNIVGGHTLSYNRGSMAVALLGCFQSSDSACKQLNPSANAPSSAMMNGLTDVLAWSATKFEIDPVSQQIFCQYDGSGCLFLHTISGHRDANSTSCPGELAYQQLQNIRNITASKKANGYSYAAKQITYPYLNLGDNNEVTTTLQFKNTGTSTWYNTGPTPITLGTSNSDDHPSIFQATGWLSNNRAAVLDQSSVPPGSTGSFTFKIKNPPGYIGNAYEYFKLVAEGHTSFKGYIGLPMLTRNFTYSFNSQSAFTDNTKSTQLNLDGLSPGSTAWLMLEINNTGNTTWYNTGTNSLTLATDVQRDRLSQLCTNGWLSCNRAARMLQSSVPPGGTARFEFPVVIPASGQLKEYFTPVVEGLTWMPSVGIYFQFSVNTHYAWEYIKQEYYTDGTRTTPIDAQTLLPNQTFFVVLIARNTGNTTWYNSSLYPLKLGTAVPKDKASSFYHSSWLAPSRAGVLKQAFVPPGQTAEYEGTFTAPASSGPHKEYFQPVAENLTWLNDLGLYVATNVRKNYSWSFVTQQAYTDASMSTPVDTRNLSPGQRFYFTVTGINNGSSIWYRDGANPVMLGTSRPRDRMSSFQDLAWWSPNRPAKLSESSVAPDGTAHFGNYYTAPSQKGVYSEYLLPVAEGITWLNDLGLYIPIEVK